MTSTIDNSYFTYNALYLFLSNLKTNTILNNIINDAHLSFSLVSLSSINLSENTPVYLTNTFLNLYMQSYLSNLIFNNSAYFLLTVKTGTNYQLPYYTFYFLKKLFKLNLFIFIIYTIFFVTNFENYFKQQRTINYLTKLFILNATEKEVGPVDDYFFFAILFILTISLFIFTAISLILLQTNILIWGIGAFFLLTILILSIPVNLFIDFGVIFCVTIKGSASSNNFIKELLFDIISTTTVFIRFVIQNIRFFFIFSGIFELLEWVLSGNAAFFTSNIIAENNIFTVNVFNNTNFAIKNINYLLINTILFIILYFYYLLHLLFLLLVQVTIYVGISIWLFFFLYSTKFLTKYEKFFIFKKI